MSGLNTTSGRSLMLLEEVLLLSTQHGLYCSWLHAQKFSIPNLYHQMLRIENYVDKPLSYHPAPKYCLASNRQSSSLKFQSTESFNIGSFLVHFSYLQNCGKNLKFLLNFYLVRKRPLFFPIRCVKLYNGIVYNAGALHTGPASA